MNRAATPHLPGMNACPTSSKNSGASATPSATTASTTATTSSRSPTCSSSRWPTSAASTFPKDCDWPTLRDYTGTELTDHYIDILRKLGKAAGLLGDIYAGAQSRFKNPVNLKRLIGLIDETEWTALGVDVKAAAYEGLLEKAASEGKKGAGQYFTPRVLIQSIVRCMKPDPRVGRDFTICDPACGTGGFLVCRLRMAEGRDQGGALDRDMRQAHPHRHLLRAGPGGPPAAHGPHEPVPAQHRAADHPGRLHLRAGRRPPLRRGPDQSPLRHQGREPGPRPRRLHRQHVQQAAQLRPARPDDPEARRPGRHRAARQLPLRRPGRRGLQDRHRGLRPAHRPAPAARHLHPVQPGRQGQRRLLHQGGPTETTWIYDARTNVPGITKKDRPLTPAHFAEFEKCYGPDPNGRAKRKPADSKEDRWRSFSIAEVKDRDFKLDSFKWLKEESLEDADDLPEPEELATDAIAELEGAVEELNAVLVLLENGGKG